MVAADAVEFVECSAVDRECEFRRASEVGVEQLVDTQLLLTLEC